MPSEDRLTAYAELAVRVGANVAASQNVNVIAMIEHAPLARALTRAAYDAGARHVTVLYVDKHVQHAHIERAPEESLGWTPAWAISRVEGSAQATAPSSRSRATRRRSSSKTSIRDVSVDRARKSWPRPTCAS